MAHLPVSPGLVQGSVGEGSSKEEDRSQEARAEGGGGMGDGWGHVGREFPREWRGMIFDERDRVLVAWR